MVDKGELHDQVMLVPYTKGMEEVNILLDRDQSVPLTEEVTLDSFLRYLYPRLLGVAMESVNLYNAYGVLQTCK